MNLIILTGASGAGKTAIGAALKNTVDVVHFDGIGVPCEEDMIAEWGSPHGWQQAMTVNWLERLAAEARPAKTLFEGQMRPSYIENALQKIGLPDIPVILIDCDDETRLNRLIHKRGQPHLANAAMLNFAAQMRVEAAMFGYSIMDTSNLALAACVETIEKMFEDSEQQARNDTI